MVSLCTLEIYPDLLQSNVAPEVKNSKGVKVGWDCFPQISFSQVVHILNRTVLSRDFIFRSVPDNLTNAPKTTRPFLLTVNSTFLDPSLIRRYSFLTSSFERTQTYDTVFESRTGLWFVSLVVVVFIVRLSLPLV